MSIAVDALELRARFLRSVKTLGGLDIATPKGVVELMRVQGVTIQHVKSHLQKYRLQEQQMSKADVQRAIEGVEHRGEEFFDVHVCRAASDNRQRGEGHSESRLDYEQSTTRGDYFASKRHRE